MIQDEAVQQRLLATFGIEAAERLAVLSSGLIELERAETLEQRAPILESLVREAHSLKGASRSVNLKAIEALAGAMEQVLAALKRGETEVSAGLFDALHRAVDGVERYLASPGAGDGETAALRELARALRQPPVPLGEAPPPVAVPMPAPGAEPPPAPDTVRIPTARLGALLLEVEQLLASKLAAEQHVAELREARHGLAEWKKALAKALPGQRLLEAERQRLKRLDACLDCLERSAEQDYRSLSGGVANLREEIRSVLMLPVSTVVGAFPKMVRDLARAQGKEVEWVVSGGEIEIDKRILDEIRDPLIHLVRNGIDHGIETPDQRAAKGKPRSGRITLCAEQRSADRIEISVEDDGVGMDAGGIRAAALEQGLVAPSAAGTLSEEEALSLALCSGVTTSPTVTDISGRGLGLAIVQEKVARLNGTLAFDTRPGAGTRWRMELPLTLATFRGVLIRCADHLLIVPTANVEQVLRVAREEIKTVESRATIRWRDRVVSLVRLAEVLELSGKTRALHQGKVQVAVLSAGTEPIAFVVDEIQGEQEVLVKPLGSQLVRVRNIAGAAVLGSGRVVPILNVRDLLVSAVRPGGRAFSAPTAESAAQGVKSLLVVEDSITTRTLLKNILEGAGYEVATAVDGVDALTQLGERDFDLVVSDVAMPRMDGFGLTARIRADRRLAAMPVVLVTALESRQERERGIDVGANAYLVKSSFDQGNLLEIIRRLV